MLFGVSVMRNILGWLLFGVIYSGAALADVYDRAEVLNVTPRFKTYSAPRTDCWNELNQPTQGQADRDRTAIIIGEVVGAVINGQSGKPKGKPATTGTRRCTTVNEEKKKPDGFDVTYSFGGKVMTDRLSYNPGSSVKIRLVIQ